MSRSISRQIKPFLAMQVLEKALAMQRTGTEVIMLSVGQPDFPTPECVMEAAHKAMRDGHTGYTHSLGIWELREAVSEYYHQEYGLDISPERVIISGGSSPAMFMLFTALLEEGDEVIIGNPAYACYESYIRNAGGIPRALPVQEENRFQLDPSEVRAALTPRTRAILINSPSNPAGTIMSGEDIRALAGLCAGSDLDSGPLLISDEIYHGLNYDGPVASALEFSDRVCVVDGFSKRYAMTGWRLGWLVVPPGLVPLLNTLQQNFFICAPSIAQWAGIAALREAGPDTRRMAAEYDRRRGIIIDLLRGLGFGVNSSPSGAFYILADARNLGRDSLALAHEILERTGVAVAPGVDFGSEAEGYLRFSYASSVDNIRLAMEKIRSYLEQRRV
ncbi:MAG: pyridoxal phosphate-dependent aminotransferase [Desulfovibrionaceae bacterium]|nr:pyridoxal phosphate-dependent aminotransferase [Desulfovibrionaceae bacterium]